MTGRSHRCALTSLAAGAVVLTGCGTGLLPGVSGSGTVVESTVEVDAITALTVGSAFDVVMRRGDEPGLLLRADDNVIDRVDATQAGGQLDLRVDTAVRDATLEAVVTVAADSLTRLQLDGAATLSSTETLRAPALTVQANGASRAFVVLDVDALAVTASGASVVNASGIATDLSADADGASTLRLDQLATRTADVRATGASTIEVLVSESLDARADGASTIGYLGDPVTVEQQATGASTVVAR